MSSKEIKKEKALNANSKVLKGCNCKRTKCQKNFCDCYKNSKLCTELCKCIDCRNVNEIQKNATPPLLDVVKNENESYYTEQLPEVAEETYVIENEIPISCYTIAPQKKHLNVLTRDIIESTIECIVSQAEECQNNNVTAKAAELLVIEEFGRCLEDIRRLTNIQNILD